MDTGPSQTAVQVSPKTTQKAKTRLFITLGGLIFGLFDDQGQQMIDAEVDEIHISLDVADQAEYNRVKQKDLYEKVMKNIYDILPQYATDNCGKTQLFIKIALPMEEHEDFWGGRSVTRKNFEDSMSIIREIAEDSKNVHLKIMPLFATYRKLGEFMDNAPCEMPFYMLKIKNNGNIDCCCAAIFNELNVGHIQQGLDLHDALTSIRRAHLSGNVSKYLPMCGSCSAKTVVNVDLIKDQLCQFI